MGSEAFCLHIVKCILKFHNFHAYVFYWLQRDCGRPPVPRKDPGDKPEEESLKSNHPYVDKVLL